MAAGAIRSPSSTPATAAGPMRSGGGVPAVMVIVIPSVSGQPEQVGPLSGEGGRSAGGAGLVQVGDQFAPVIATVTGRLLPAPVDPQRADCRADLGVRPADQFRKLIQPVDDPAHGRIGR